MAAIILCEKKMLKLFQFWPKFCEIDTPCERRQQLTEVPALLLFDASKFSHANVNRDNNKAAKQALEKIFRWKMLWNQTRAESDPGLEYSDGSGSSWQHKRESSKVRIVNKSIAEKWKVTEDWQFPDHYEQESSPVRIVNKSRREELLVLTSKERHFAGLPSRTASARSMNANLIIPRHTTSSDKSVLTVGASCWNNLPVDIKLKPTLTQFKGALKKHIRDWTFVE